MTFDDGILLALIAGFAMLCWRFPGLRSVVAEIGHFLAWMIGHMRDEDEEDPMELQRKADEKAAEDAAIHYQYLKTVMPDDTW